MNNYALPKVIVFAVCAIGLYLAFSSFLTPPIKPEPPPQEDVVSDGLSLEEFVSLGRRIYDGKGSCALCHNAVGNRAPLLYHVAVDAAGRIKSPGYKGAAKDAVAYVYESMTVPSAYVVPGYGNPGSNDGISPMPDVRTQPIGLSEDEIRAVIAFLQRRAGLPVSVEPAKGKE